LTERAGMQNSITLGSIVWIVKIGCNAMDGILLIAFVLSHPVKLFSLQFKGMGVTSLFLLSMFKIFKKLE
jgi:hypothetical protein